MGVYIVVEAVHGSHRLIDPVIKRAMKEGKPFA